MQVRDLAFSRAPKKMAHSAIVGVLLWRMSAPEKSEDLVAVGQAMQRCRNRCGLKQKEVVSLTADGDRPIRERTLKQWEAGEVAAPVWAILTLARLYRCTADQLLGLEPPQGQVLVDRVTADRILATTKKTAPDLIRELVGLNPGEPIQWIMMVPESAEWLEASEVRELRERVFEHLKHVAPNLLLSWTAWRMKAVGE